VTGASSGIGRATAVKLGGLGYEVLVHARANRTGATETAEAVRAAGGRAEPILADLTKPSEVERLGNAAADGGALRLLVHNAGEYPRVPISEQSADGLRAVFDAHVFAPLLLTQRLRSSLEAAAPARVVFVSSLLAVIGSRQGAAYAAAKAAQLGLVRSLAQELAPRILVNAVAPGTIDTAIVAGDSKERRAERERAIPLHRIGRPEEVAESIAFLASDGASYITGTTLHVNGGLPVP
jgi:3-oxoacyl-[acyl-carrier protein] reductase